MIDFTPLQKLPKNVEDLGKLIVAKGFKKLPNLVTLALTKVASKLKNSISDVTTNLMTSQ